MNEDIVDKINSEDLLLQTKIIRLWAVAMLNYRQPLGNKAWDTITRLTNNEVSAAIAYLTGWCMAEEDFKIPALSARGDMAGSITEEKLKKMLRKMD